MKQQQGTSSKQHQWIPHSMKHQHKLMAAVETEYMECAHLETTTSNNNS
jgi:hypothetical protein